MRGAGGMGNLAQGVDNTLALIAREVLRGPQQVAIRSHGGH